MSEENRLIDLEIKISHQDQIIEDLHQVIYQQQLTIDALEKRLTLLEKRFNENATGGLDIRGHEKPPHY